MSEYNKVLTRLTAQSMNYPVGHLMCIIESESGFDEKAVGAQGEQGLGQIKPTTGAYMLPLAKVDLPHLFRQDEALDLFNPIQNLRLTVYGLQRWPDWWSTIRVCGYRR